MVENIDKIIPYGVLAMQVGAVALLLALVFARNSSFIRLIGEKALLLSFIVTLATVLGSLFYSSVLDYEPCLLCWWQRIFLFPQLILFGLALWHKRSDVFLYTTALSIAGIAVAIYQIVLPYLGRLSINCGTAAISCLKQYVLAFGYITIPVMSLTVFVALILIALTSKITNKANV